MKITFTMLGRPVPKGRPRFTKTGRTYTPKDTLDFERRVAETYTSFARIAGAEITDKPVIMTIHAYFPIPESAKRKRMPDLINEGDPFVSRPDLDNLVKAIQDGLNGVAYKDDAQVWALVTRKQYSDRPCVMVTVEWEDDSERSGRG